LTGHVTSSVGWIGAVVVFLALAILGINSDDEQRVRGAYLVMEPLAWSVLVPLAFASLITGIVMSLGTPWGLFRHYWVVFKLLITVFATVVLLIYMRTFAVMATIAGDPAADLDAVRNPSPILHAVLALLILLIATVLAVYKPRGTTPYGRRAEGGTVG
jgi:NADH:ubiquinone oxidoreductase subunit 6 (subunit J)